MLDRAGLGLRAPIEIERYDAAVPEAWRSRELLPGARAAIMIASGGRSLWDAFSRSPEFAASDDPLDAYTRRVTEAAAACLDQAGEVSRVLLAFERRAGVYADFVALGRLAGLGAPSRLGLLIHPTYGLWLSLRAVVLTRGRWERGPDERVGFDPCPGCPAPCAVAGPGAAARLACVIGPEHAYSKAALAHHMRHVRLP